MKRRHPPRLPAVIIAALVTLLALSGYAQSQTGNIYGKVVSKDGSMLPGVSVVLRGIGAPQTFITDTNGAFRFLNLSPGAYDLKADLSGFGSSVRGGVRVSVGSNADVIITLNPSVTESITVTAAAPLLDVRKTGTGATMTRVELEKIPSARDPWVMLQQTPGVLVDRVNVGGNESGQQSSYVGKGAVSSQSTWNVDGVNITDVGALGSSPTYYDFDSFEEMQITTGGADPRIQTPGVQLNMVTKRGSNDFKGSGRYYKTTNDWQADPTIPTEAAAYLLRVNEIENITDGGIEVGGPVLSDRLWFWGAYSNQNINLLTATILAGSRFLDQTDLRAKNAKINAQITSTNSLNISAMKGDKIKLGRNVGPSRLPVTSWNQKSSYPGPTTWKIEDTQIFSPNFYLTGLYSKVEGGFQLIADNGKRCEDYGCGLDAQPAYLDLVNTGAWNRSYASYVTGRPSTQYRADSAAFFGTGSINHELKFGFGYRDADVTSQSAWPQDQYLVLSSGTPGTPGAGGGVSFQRPTNFTYNVQSTDLYVGDTMMFGNLSLQAGLRYDMQKGAVSAGATTANKAVPDLLPAITWNAISGLEWKSIAPRIGLTYTLGAERKTLLRAGYNRYVDQLGGSTVYNPSPGGYQYLYYYFTDLNGDLRASRNEITDLAGGPISYSGLDPSRPGVPLSTYRWDKNFDAPNTDELILGFERELMTDFVVGLNGTYRKMNDFIEFRGEKTQGAGDLFSSADYVLNATNATGTFQGETYSLPYYRLKAGTSAPVFFVIRNRDDYSQTYKGLELNLTKRMSNRWMMRGNVSLNDWTQEVGSGGIVDPTRQRGGTGCTVCDGSAVVQGSGTGSGSKGGIYINSKWSSSVTGLYQVPFIETSVGFNLNSRQGYPKPYVHRVSVPGGEGFKFLLLDDVDAERNPTITTLDLRLAKDIRVFRSAGFTLSVDAFNVFNKNTIIQRDVRRVNGLASADRITEVLSPRVFRLGARVTF